MATPFSFILIGAMAVAAAFAAVPAQSPESPAPNATAAPSAAPNISVFDGFIPKSEFAAIAAGTSTLDVTVPLQRALRQVQDTGGVLRFPAGTYVVSELVLTGRNYRLETAGVTFRQRRGTAADGDLHPVMTVAQGSSNIVLGDLRFQGNIASDRGEFAHGLAVLSAQNVTVGNVFGQDIRGDVLYIYGRTSAPADETRGLKVGIVSGRNVYRSIVSMVGGEAQIAGVESLGAVGYRDIDVEPNSGGDYQPVTLRVGFVRGATVQITSDDIRTLNAHITIDSLDLNGDRVRDTVPGYPRHPGVNATGLSINRTDTVVINDLRMRNYASFPVLLADRWRAVSIGNFDFANVDTHEPTYNAVVLQYHEAGPGVLSIARTTGTLAGNDKFFLRADVGELKVSLGTVELAGGSLGAYVAGSVGVLVSSGPRATRACEIGCVRLKVAAAR